MFKFIDNQESSKTGVLFLHGFGADMNDLYPMKMLFPNTRVISYQAPISLAAMGYMGGFAWFSLDFTPYGIEYDVEEAEAVLANLHKEIEKQRAHFDRLIICGFSQGAILSHALLLRYPGLLDGAVCLSGRYSDFIFEDVNHEHLKGLPVFLSHGTVDEVIPISSGKEIMSFYEETDANLTSKVYEMGHDISYECQLDLKEWFKSNFL